MFLLGTLAAFQLLAWLLFELQYPGHHFDASVPAHLLKAFPGEMLLQSVLGPLLAHLAVPALFSRGNLFDWDPPGWLTILLPVYWGVLAGASIAFVATRRLLWWLVVALVLLATAPRLGGLILAALSVT